MKRRGRNVARLLSVCLSLSMTVTTVQAGMYPAENQMHLEETENTGQKQEEQISESEMEEDTDIISGTQLPEEGEVESGQETEAEEELKSETDEELKNETETGGESDSEEESGTELEPELETEAEVKPETELESEPEVETENEAEIETETEPESEAELEIEEELESETVTEIELETEEELIVENTEEIVLTAEADGIEVMITAEAGVFPKDTELHFERIDAEKEISRIETSIEKSLKKESSDKKLFQVVAFDVTFMCDGEEIQPDGKVQMTFRYLENEKSEEAVETAVYHLDEDFNHPEVLESEAVEGEIRAVTEHFSPIVITFLTAPVSELGVVEAGSEKTVAEVLEALTEEAVSQADGVITIQLTGDTNDTKNIFLPMDKGLKQVILTSKDGTDYKLGATPVELFANGIPFVFEHGKLRNLYGGGENITLDNTDITIRGGSFFGVPSQDKGNIIGGSKATRGGVDISITGSTNVTIEDCENMTVSSIYGGSYTNASDVKAAVDNTNLTIRNSNNMSICTIAGGSFVWGAPGSNVVLETEETNLLFENSSIKMGYIGFDFSVYGGHMGNDEVENLDLYCGAANITVVGTELIPDRYGGEIFGGSYDTDTTGTDKVRMDEVNIYLEDSSVNGVFGGGYYNEQCAASTGAVDITVKNCILKQSGAVDIPIVCGGDIYLTKVDYGIEPSMETVEINLFGENKMPDGEERLISVYAEGIKQVEKSMMSLLPENAYLDLDKDTLGCLAELDLDSNWSAVTLGFKSGRSKTISEYEDYKDLLQQINKAIVLDEKTQDSQDKVTGDITPETVETPELPADSSLTEEAVIAKKKAAIAEMMDALDQTTKEKESTSLIEVVEDLELENPETIDRVDMFLKMEVLDMVLAAEGSGDSIAIVSQKLILDVAPYAQVTRKGSSPDEAKKVDNKYLSNLNGGKIEFYLGVPSSITAKYADIIHYLENGGIESYQREIQQDSKGKFVKLDASSFSKFEVEFTNEKQGGDDTTPDVPDPEEPIPDVPKPEEPEKTKYRDSSDSSESQGRWIQNTTGWWYRYPAGTWPSNSWAYLYYGNRYAWYYFNKDGYMVDGWLDLNGSRYYLHTVSDGLRGYMYTGWNEIDGKWYYFETETGPEQGKLYVNKKTPDGWQTGSDGARVS